MIIEPRGPLSEEDFRQLASDVDRHLARTRKLDGILVCTAEFPGWQGIGAMIKHIRFVKDHHLKIRKVALASDSALTGIAQYLGKHFVNAEVKTFPYAKQEEALAWLRERA